MAATLSSLVTTFLDKLSSVIREEMSIPSEVRSELEELEQKIKEIQCLLADAESRAFYSEAIRLWLKELKEVMYDADDLVDDCKVAGETTASGKQLGPSSSVRGVRNLLSSSLSSLNNVLFKRKVEKGLESIKSRLEEISRERSQLMLRPINVVENKSRRFINNHQTSSLIQDDITGEAIQMDSKKLIKALIEVGSGVDLIAITGMGGIGKTTLAQVIYNDQLISAGFQMKIWVCVSKDSAGIKLLKGMVECTGVEPGEAHSTEQLQLMLWSLTRGKKILLVLDDIWSADAWENLLRDPLRGAAAGSKVLITTRFETVAREVGAVHLHRVEQMPIADGWSLLCKKVCTYKEDLSELESLRDVGVRIVERCDGLPLAIKVVGGVLRGRDRSREEWEEVLHSRTWSSSIFPEDMKDMVMEALHLSYEDLPSHLKQCFLYLSLFPEDHVFKRPSVVRQWIAEGFVKPEGDASVLEDIGSDYFKELVDRSLLQPELAIIDGAQCKMHDLLRSLAQFLAEDENLFGDTSELRDASPKLRRLSMADSDGMMDLDVLKAKACLRTLFLSKNPHAGMVLTQELAIETLGRLRVLDLRGAHMEEFPYAVTKLTHLRYLDVSSTAIRELPESISDLRSLQFLLLNNCSNIRALPNGITKLKNLRTLELYNGTKVDQMPKGIGGLNQLRTLNEFVVDRHEGALEELGSLVNLGMLVIAKLDRVFDKEQARRAALAKKTSLFWIYLECTLQPWDDKEEEIMKRRMVDVFDELCPPRLLRLLSITGYVGLRLPCWLWPSASWGTISPVHNLTIFELDYCINFSEIPPLGLLPHLKQLWIKGAFAVTSIIPTHSSPSPSSSSSFSPTSSSTTDATAAASTTTLFPKLEWLRLADMPKLEKIWDRRREDNNGEGAMAFPCLRNLSIGDCPKLTCLPDTPLPVLKFLQISRCPALVEVGNLSAPDILRLEDGKSETLPAWLGQVSIDPENDSSFLNLNVSRNLLERLLQQKGEDDPDNPEGDWHIIKHFPRVYAKAVDDEHAFLTYIKNAPSFGTNLQAANRNGNSADGKRRRRRRV
ncbi:hypothetical protein Taro_042427 [Colocasia esculenta]|uniref:Uncharacterized protein n=1 Tax=Colocasia esculenta TaxID=4460 RepID=A0A843WST2_COLES|nr:hypothetical protein [Colocasia esculenta]